MSNQPSTNGVNGRDQGGRFAKGNAGGPGNPHARSVGAWRAALAETVKPEDIREVVGVLIGKAKDGERWAVVELLARCIGSPKADVDEHDPDRQTHVVVTYELAEGPSDD